MHPFMLRELVLVLAPFVAFYYAYAFLGPSLNLIKKFKLTVPFLLLPLWMMLIYIFGNLLFRYNLLPFALFVACFEQGLFLYNYVRKINVFTFKRYYIGASNLLFIQLTLFLIGLIGTRILTWFNIV